VQKLFRFTESVVFSFDGDSAGQRAARKALMAALPFATDVRTVKFLFLPPEHDPDSFIREHGSERFADCVAKAVPLSKFMLQAAAEGCDLDTAEGRAHMASNAKPLWSALPDGALRRQLLAEIADQVMLDSRDLTQMWQSTAPRTGRNYKNDSSDGMKSLSKSVKTPQNAPIGSLSEGDLASDQPSEPYGNGDGDAPGFGADAPPDDDYPPPDDWDRRYGTAVVTPGGAFAGYGGYQSARGRGGNLQNREPRRVAGRVLPASREDRVLRLLLTQAGSWDRLNSAEHQVLLALPAPHGPLFTWFEAQLHEHGPQPWAALREGLRGHDHERHAVVQVSQMLEGVAADWSEVRGILDQLLMRQQDAEKADLAARASSDPAAMQKLRELMAQPRIARTGSPTL
jgi:DNA primase